VLNKAKVFAHWQEQGLFAPIDPAHFLFLLWSTTQAYADMQVQFAAVLGRKNLIAEDFEKGVETLMQLVDSVCLQKGNAD
jgi:TetR/AcrR family transcriptional regulator